MAHVSTTSALTQAFVAALFGLIVLPTLFVTTATAGIATGGPISLSATAWLAVATLLSFWLVALVPGLANGMAALLDRLNARDRNVTGRPVLRNGSGGAARLLVVVVVLVVIQAIVRRPLVSVLGVVANPLTVEAVFAAATLGLLLLVLVWLHRTARPLVEAVTWQALDALVATSGSETSTRRAADAETEAATVLERTKSGATFSGGAAQPTGVADATIAESSRQLPIGDSADTVAAPIDAATLVAAGDATIAAAEDVTRPDPFTPATAQRPALPADDASATPREHPPLEPSAAAVAEATLPGDPEPG